MNVFEKVKASVSVRQAAESLGLKAGQNGMAICPFHNDRHPSLKLNDGYFYCFGCGASGDVIKLTSKLTGLNRTQAAWKLATDFGICKNDVQSVGTPIKNYSEFRKYENKRLYFIDVLRDYLTALEKWKAELAPESQKDEFDEKYAESCQMLPYIGYLVDVLELGSESEKLRTVEMLSADDVIPRLERRLKRIRKEEEDEKNRRKADGESEKCPAG